MSPLSIINDQLKTIEQIVNDDSSVKISNIWHTGIDLGTADIVLTVCDDAGNPLACFMEWAEVVRDGIVLDYYGAVQIVKRLKAQAEKKLGIEITRAITSYPPGTDPQISKNVLDTAGIAIENIIDEPSSVAELLKISNGAVVDIGGGTTGIAIIDDGKIVYSADEATGGRHATLTIAGNQKIDYNAAESMKINGQPQEVLAIIQPVFEKMAEIIMNHLASFKVKTVYLTGGTCCFPGIKEIFENELENKEIIVPYNPLYLTPLAIACYRS